MYSDRQGMRTVRCKGGYLGFVHASNDAALLLPSYDRNGMVYSTGNVATTGWVGLRFMDIEKPLRLRIQGENGDDLT